MTKIEGTAVGGIIGFYAVLIAGLGGWIANICKIVACATGDVELGIMFFARCVGAVVAPLGAILGYC